MPGRNFPIFFRSGCPPICKNVFFVYIESQIANLTKLILKPCIRIPMAPSQMDADHVRISALLLLREWARKGNPAAVKACSSIMNELNQAKDDSELRTPEFDEYRRQMEAVFQGKKVQPKEIKPIRLNFTTAPAPAEK